MRTRITLFPLLAGALAAACGGGSGGPPVHQAPVADTIRTIEGRIAYYTTGPRLDTDADGRLVAAPGFVVPTFPRGAPRIPVQVLSPAGALLATTVTDANGDYSVDVNFGQNPATQVVVRTRAQLHLPFGTIVRVLANATSAEPYTHETPPSGTPANDTMNVDLEIPLAGGAGAYFIVDTLYEAFVAAKAGISFGMPNMDVYWEPGNGSVSTLATTPSLARLTVAGGLPGVPSSNQDVWDEAVLTRLVGEYLLAYFFGEAPPDGIADGLVVPSAAWREGFLDFWACFGRGSSVYYDTEGIGAAGRIVRYFDVESFFDPSLGSLGPDDPNVYQPPDVIGIASRFTVAELLWDIHDGGTLGQDDPIEFPLFVTFRKLQTISSERLPYLVTLFDMYVSDGSLDPVTLDLLTRSPEDQGFSYPATRADGTVWPPPIEDPAMPGDPLVPPFDTTISDTHDSTGTNDSAIAFSALRYFGIDLAQAGQIEVTLTTTGSLIVELLDANHDVLASGANGLVAPIPDQGQYYLRVRSGAGPQDVAFDLRLVYTP